MPESTPGPKPRRIRRWLIAGGVALVALCLATGIAGAALVSERLMTTHYRLDGDAMAPCFSTGARIEARRLDDVDRLALRHGDIVVFDAPLAANKPHIKRIVAIGDDQIAIRNGQVVVNGAVLAEPYIARPALYRYPLPDGNIPYTVPAGAFFILGDNRNNSADSHFFGAVTHDRVTHKVTSPCAGQPARP